MQRYRRLIITGGFLCCVSFLTYHAYAARPVHAETLEELKSELEDKRKTLEDHEKRIEKFKEEIQIKKKEARTLEDQIEIIDDNIEELRLRLDQTVVEIEKTNVEIETVEKEIEVKGEEISYEKEVLAEYLRSLYNHNQQSGVAVFLGYDTFSEAVSEASTLNELQDRSRLTLIAIKQLKEELEQRKASLEDIKITLDRLHERQQQQQATLASSRTSKTNILELTREQEGQYASLLQDAKAAHEEAQAEIARLDTLIREELSKQGVGSLPSVGTLSWPIQPIFGVSCEFHCSGYPYAYLIGPHSGMDIPSYVGTPIAAPADGYVGRAHQAQGAGYSYILLIHGDNISTVYGHVSGFNVQEGQMVARGDIIGYTGGAPGTNGAGLSSGPHLHFEVRMDNVPINPRQYL